MTTHQRNFASIDPIKLERLAETAVKVGVGLEKGQDLFMTAPVAALPLARRIAAQAYKAGAGLVTPILSDEEITLARYRFAPEASFDRAPGWLYEGVAKAFGAIAPGSPLSARIRCCSPTKIPPRSPAPTRPTHRLSASPGEDRRLRHQLEHRRLSDPLVGQASLSG